MYNTLSNIYQRKILLNEFSEAAINSFIQRFQSQDPSQSEESIRADINKFDRVKDSPRFSQIVQRFYPNIRQPRDPISYTYEEFRTVLNWFGSGDNTSTTPTLLPEEQPGIDPIIRFDDGSFVIYALYTQEQARRLIADILPALSGGKKYTFCIQDSSGVYWRSYRFDRGQTFYAAIDKTKNFRLDSNSVLIIRPYINAGSREVKYNVSDANNWDRNETWERIVELQPKLENKQDIFVPRSLSQAETIQKEMGSNVTPDTFGRISYQAKTMYISLGKKIYVTDFEILDKELQNSYINAQGNQWGVLSIGNETVIELYQGIYPFAVKNSSNFVTSMLQLFLNIIFLNDKNTVLGYIPVLSIVSKGVVKRYFEHLERYQEDIFKKTRANIANIVPLLRHFLNNDMYNTSSRLDKDVVDAFKKIKQNINFFTMLSENEVEQVLKTQFLIKEGDFIRLPDRQKAVYINTWFDSDGTYKAINPNNQVLEYDVLQTNILDFLQDSNTERLWSNIYNYNTYSEIVDVLPGVSASSNEIKRLFTRRLEEYCNKDV